LETKQQALEELQLQLAGSGAEAVRTEASLRAKLQSLTEAGDGQQRSIQHLTQDLAVKTSLLSNVQAEFQAYKVYHNF
jgi:hypothetical protein